MPEPANKGGGSPTRKNPAGTGKSLKKAAPRATKPKQRTAPVPVQTEAKRQNQVEYDRQRNKSPERVEYQRLWVRLKCEMYLARAFSSSRDTSPSSRARPAPSNTGSPACAAMPSGGPRIKRQGEPALHNKWELTPERIFPAQKNRTQPKPCRTIAEPLSARTTGVAWQAISDGDGTIAAEMLRRAREPQKPSCQLEGKAGKLLKGYQ